MEDCNSVTNAAIECPVCKNDLTVKHIFNHIKIKHPGYFQQQTTKKWLQESQLGKPLKIFWNKKNDFDEEDTFVVFGCLSSGKTFTTESRGVAHFRKNPNDLKNHNEAVTYLLSVRDDELKKERKIEEQLQNTPPEKSEYQEMKKTNHPELCSALLDVINNHLEVCDKLAKDVKANLNMTSKVFNANAAGSKKSHTIQELLELLEHWRAKINPSNFDNLSNVLAFLWHFLQIRKFFNGHLAPELGYPWFNTPDHPKGELSYGISRFAKYIWPWETPMTPIDNSTCWIEV
tara:strand:+ start:428 stop:1294 length:867 start_codon:yes stop_codon:yes gene_type:complete